VLEAKVNEDRTVTVRWLPLDQSVRYQLDPSSAVTPEVFAEVVNTKSAAMQVFDWINCVRHAKWHAHPVTIVEGCELSLAFVIAITLSRK
jgi:hypothetical protein